MNAHIATFALGAAIAIWLSIAMYIWPYRIQYRAVVYAAIGVAMCIAFWQLLYAFEIAAPTAELKFLAHRLKQIGEVFTSMAAFVFAAQVSQRDHWVTPPRLILMHIIPCATLILVFTNHAHGLMWSALWLEDAAGLLIVKETQGVWSWVSTGYQYTAAFAACVLVIRHLRGAPQLFRYPLLIVALALGIPFVGSLITTSRTTHLSVTPFFLGLGGLMVLWALLRNKTFDLTPLARNLVTHSMTDGMIVADLAGRILSANPTGRQLLSLRRDEAVGRHVKDFAHIFGDAAQTQPLRFPDDPFETTISVAGEEKAFELRASPLTDVRKRMAGYVIVLRDITDHKRSQQALQQALERERELNVLRARFVSIISHEFRTPMSIIQTSNELLQNYGTRMNAETTSEKLSTIKAQVGVMNALIDDVLSLDRLQSGKLAYSPECLPVAATLRSLVDEYTQDTHSTARVIFSAQPNIPDALLDRKLLRLVVRNLVGNALKYSLPEQQVEIEVTADDQRVYLHVKDHGIGIPLEEQNRLFDPFYRAANVGDIPGSGLGLMIVKQVVDQHRGSIGFRSMPNSGTTFTVALERQGQGAP